MGPAGERRSPQRGHRWTSSGPSSGPTTQDGTAVHGRLRGAAVFLLTPGFNLQLGPEPPGVYARTLGNELDLQQQVVRLRGRVLVPRVATRL